MTEHSNTEQFWFVCFSFPRGKLLYYMITVVPLLRIPVKYGYKIQKYFLELGLFDETMKESAHTPAGTSVCGSADSLDTRGSSWLRVAASEGPDETEGKSILPGFLIKEYVFVEISADVTVEQRQ